MTTRGNPSDYELGLLFLGCSAAAPESGVGDTACRGDQEAGGAEGSGTERQGKASTLMSESLLFYGWFQSVCLT